MCLQHGCFFLLGWTLAAVSARAGTDDPAVIGKAGAAEVSAVAKRIVRETNAFRASQKRSQLETSATLIKTAESFAGFMARTDEYGHEADGKQPADRAKDQGYESCIIAENIAYQLSSEGFTTEDLATRFVEGWENSPGHRRNMLDADVTETGVGVAWSARTGRYYAVQLFGRPKSLAIVFQISNRAETEVRYQLDDQTFPLPPRVTRTHEICRPDTLRFQWPENSGKPAELHPRKGDHFQVEKERDAFVIKKVKG